MAKEIIFVFPVGDHSSKVIANYIDSPEAEHRNTTCYVGKNKIPPISVYEISNMQFESLKRAEISFYAFKYKFKPKGGESRRQYFHCQNINGERKTDKTVAKIAELVEKLAQLEKKE